MKKAKKNNPFLFSEDDFLVIQESYIHYHYFKTINGKVEETGNNRFDLNFEKNNFNKKDMSCLVNKKVTSCTKSVMFYVLSNLDADSDVVIINTSKVSECTGYAKSAISSSINELSKMDFLKKINGRGMTSKYWINPLKIFKGNRIDFLESYRKDYVKIVKHQDISLDKPLS